MHCQPRVHGESQVCGTWWRLLSQAAGQGRTTYAGFSPAGALDKCPSSHCTISPQTSSRVVAAMRDGFTSPDDCHILIDRAGLPGGRGFNPDEMIDTDDEDSFFFFCGKCVSSAYGPPSDIVARHNLTHLPYQSWCPQCVAARKNNVAHQEGESASRALPLVVFE